MNFGFDNNEGKDLYRIGDWCLEQLRKAGNFVKYAGLSVFMLSSATMYSFDTSEPQLSWDNAVVCVADYNPISQLDYTDFEIGGQTEESLLMKSLKSHGFDDMDYHEKSSFQEIEKMVSRLPYVREANAVFGKNSKALTIIMKFDKGLKLRMDSYYDKVDDEEPYDRNVYFTLSANGEELVEGALPIQELGERLDIFFNNI